MPDATPDAPRAPSDAAARHASPDASPGSASQRAAAAEASVGRLLTRRDIARPARRVVALARRRSTESGTDTGGGPAPADGHLLRSRHLDAVVDAGLRHVRDGNLNDARACARRGERLLAAVRRGNGRRWATDASADVASLALASGRLGRLHGLTGRRGGSRRVRSVRRELTADLRSRLSDDVAGGDPFRRGEPQRAAVGAAGAIALHLARIGDLDAARRILDGAWAERLDVDDDPPVGDRSGRDAGDGPWSGVRVADRGAALGALVTVGDPRSLERAARIVAAVDAHLARSVDGRRVLAVPEGGSDLGAVGVLARYLALAAETEQLDVSTREVAARLVRDTADALWAGRDDLAAGGSGRGGRYRGRTRGLRFSPDPARPAEEAVATGSLSPEPQLQAWTVLEAAARLA